MAPSQRGWFNSVKVEFFIQKEKQIEVNLSRAFIRGLKRHGDSGRIISTKDKTTIADADVAAIVGIKSAKLFHANRGAGKHTVLFDKGYVRHDEAGALGAGSVWHQTRAAVDAHHPTKKMNRGYPHDRANRSGLKISPWRTNGEYILLAGSSAKYHRFYEEDDPTEYARKVASEIRKHTDRPIYYRPKKSWKPAVEITGTVWARTTDPIKHQLESAWALVTHGSNACFEAMLYGVPSIILGDGVAKPISSTSLEDIENPTMAGMDERKQWLADLMYQQWTLAEYASGEAWDTIRPQITGD